MAQSIQQEILAQPILTTLPSQVTVAFVQLEGPFRGDKVLGAIHPETGQTTAAWTSEQVKSTRVRRACAIIDALSGLPKPPQIIVFSEYCIPLEPNRLNILQEKANDKKVLVIPGADNVEDGAINYSYIIEPGGRPTPVKKLYPSPGEHWLDPHDESDHPVFSWSVADKKYSMAIRICWDFDSTKAEDLVPPALVIVPMHSKDTFVAKARSLLRDVSAAFILCNAIGPEAAGSSCAIATLPSGNGVVAELPKEVEGCGIVTVDMEHLVAPRVNPHLVHRALSKDRRFEIQDDGGAVRLVPMNAELLKPTQKSASVDASATPPDMPGILKGPTDTRLIHDAGFIGRTEIVGQISELVMRSDGPLLERFLVLTGEPGLGKTEVCKAALAECLGAEDLERRILWVDATGAFTSSEFEGSFAAALGRTTVTSRDEIVADFRTYPAIVYVDNLEDALASEDAQAANVQLLQDIIAASGKSILATSRRDLPGQARNISLDPLPPGDAVRLFIQAARNAGNKNPPVDDPDLRRFLEVDLGNHPLALAIVGSHVGNGVSWESVQERWHRNFHDVAAVPGGANQRTRSLEASIDLTFDELGRGGGLARRLWAMLAYFPDGVTPHHLASAMHADPTSIATATDQLCRHSIARRTRDGMVRVLPALASYIRDAAKQGKGGLNHGYFQTRLLDWLQPTWEKLELKKKRGISYTAELDVFLKNLHSLLVLARNINSTGSNSRRVAAGAARGMRNRNLDRRPVEIRLLNLAISSLDEIQKDVVVARALIAEIQNLSNRCNQNLALAHCTKVIGDLERRLGALDEARSLYGKAKTLYQGQRSNLGLANTLESLGDLEQRLGNLGEARSLYDEAKALFQGERANLGLANTLKSLGDLEQRLDNLDEARSLYDKAKALFQGERANLGLANTLKSLGDLERHLGNLNEARSLYDKAKTLYQGERDNLGLANTVKATSDVDRCEGILNLARAGYARAKVLYDEQQDAWGRAEIVRVGGLCRMLNGDLDEAAKKFEAAAKQFALLEDPFMLSGACLGAAVAARRLGQSGEATRWLHQASDAAKRSGTPLAEVAVERVVAGEDVVDDVFDFG